MKAPDFSEKLIEVRKAKGLTQEEVAEKCNLTIRTIQRIESGKVMPRAFTIKVISEVLGFDYFETSNTGYDVKKDQHSNEKKHTITWYIKDLFNLKTNAMKKVSILSMFFLTIGLALFIVVSETNAQPSVDKTSIPDAKNSFRNYIISKDRIEVAFTNEFNLDSLVYVKNDLNTKSPFGTGMIE